MELTTRRSAIFQIAFGATAIALCVLWPHIVAAQLRSPNARKAAPDFSLTNENGTVVRLSNYKGQVVLLDFWATWCHGCKTEIPWYMEFQNKYKSRGFVVIGVSMDADGWKSVKPFMAEKKMNYDVVIGNDALGSKFGLTSMPLTLLIDRSGGIADSHAGVVDRAAWESEIQSLLGERQVAAQMQLFSTEREFLSPTLKTSQTSHASNTCAMACSLQTN